MVLCNGPYIFQEKINTLLNGLHSVRTYIDTLLIIINKSLDDHTKKLDKVLSILKLPGFKVKTAKSFFTSCAIG